MKNMLSMDGKRESKRHIKAAILGLKALEEGDPKDKLNQWWFLNEDQTDLLPQMADLVIQGYNKKQIINLLDNEYRRVIKKRIF